MSKGSRGGGPALGDRGGCTEPVVFALARGGLLCSSSYEGGGSEGVRPDMVGWLLGRGELRIMQCMMASGKLGDVERVDAK